MEHQRNKIEIKVRKIKINIQEKKCVFYILNQFIGIKITTI